MPHLNFESLVSTLSGVSTDRNGSTKGTSISINLNPNSASNSQIASSKATIIALPISQIASFAFRRNHRHGNTKLFPKLSSSIRGKSDSTVFEPPSPKVSCIGRVKSKRYLNRRLRTRQRSISSPSDVSAAAVVREKSICSQRKKKSGFIERFCAIFRGRRSGKSAQKSEIPPPGDSYLTKKRSQGRKVRDESTAIGTDAVYNESVYSEPPGLRSMSRFASGRRSGSWRVDDSEIHSSLAQFSPVAATSG